MPSSPPSPPRTAKLASGENAGEVPHWLVAQLIADFGEEPYPAQHGVLGSRLWIAPNRAAIATTRQQILATSPAVLAPGIRTLRQTADAVVSTSTRAARPLTTVMQRALITELTAAAEGRGSLGPLSALAGTPGLLNLLSTRFEQLRLLGEPIEAVTEKLRRGEGRVGAAIGRLYANYSRHLDRNGLADTAGRLTLATELLDEGASLRLLVVPWQPKELSPLEDRLLNRLTATANQTLVELAGEPGSVAVTTQATDWQKRLSEHAVELVQASSDMPVRPTAIERLRSSLFEEVMEEPLPAGSEAAIEIVAGSNEQDELRRIAKRIKQTLVAGKTKPGDIVISARRWHDRGERLMGVLDEYGIPAAMEMSPPLGRVPVMSALRQLLDVARSDWSYDTLLALLSRHELIEFRHQTAGTKHRTQRAAAEWFVRELLIPHGRRYLLRQAEALADRGADSERERTPLTSAAPEAFAALTTLAEALDLLPEEATPLEWFDRLQESLAMLGYEPAPGDEQALRSLEEALAGLETLAKWRGKRPPMLPRRRVAEWLTDWAERLFPSTRLDDEGRVRVVSVETAVGLDMRSLYVVGLSESSFASVSPGTGPPGTGPPGTGSPVKGAPVASDEDKVSPQDAEMLLFYELVTRPTEALTLSYAALDDAAQALHPSPYVTEVERLFPEGSLRPDRALLHSIDPEAPPFGPREARLAAVGLTLIGKPKLLASLPVAGPLIGSLRMIDERGPSDAFGPFEGVLASQNSSLQAALLARYGPDKVWSATQLELYATCPFKFFARHVLSAEPIGEPSLDVDYRRRGSLVHEAFVHLYKGLLKQLAVGEAPSNIGAEELVERLREAIDLAAGAKGMPLHEAALAAIEARQAVEWAELYPEQQAAFDARWSQFDEPLTPQYFEAKFGPARRAEGIDDVSTDEPFRFDLPQGEELLLSGIIDRIDVGRVGGQTVFGIVDYKTAKTVKASLAELYSGKQLQLALYTLAAAELFFGEEGASPVAAGYWAVQGKGFIEAKELVPGTVKEKEVTPNKEWLEAIEMMRQRVGEIVAGVRNGEFPMNNPDEKCDRQCDFSTICRVKQARAIGKGMPS